MTFQGWAEIAVTLGLTIALGWPLGLYMARVWRGEATWLDPVLRPVERGFYALAGVTADKQQGWMAYTGALLGFSAGVALLLVSASFAAFGTGVLRPALTSLITQQVSRGEQGVVLGLTQSLLSVAQIVAPAIAGALIDRGHLTTWALWAAAVMGAALLLNLRARGSRTAAEAATRGIVSG